jgi:NADH-quinone oxidoreductase subunit L
MAGPTPVSALIHAATMVTAGVYLVCRLSFLYVGAAEVSAVIAWVGGGTAFFAATVAIAQSDIKKVLAWSTVSQLGFMFLAAGCGAYSAAIFHLGTHAFFKALLFLAAGSVIIAMNHEQDIEKMGGLRRRIPRTRWVFLIGTLAIAGIPPLAGFFSKDEIMVAVSVATVPGHEWLYLLSLFTAGLTSFYMFRLYFKVFRVKTRIPHDVRQQLEDPPSAIIYPLYVLAFFAIFAGFAGLPQAYGDHILGGIEGSNSLANFLAPVLAAGPVHELADGMEYWLALRAVLAASAAAGVAWWIYVRRPNVSRRLAEVTARASRLLSAGYHVDALADRLVVRPIVFLSDRLLYRGIDRRLIDGALVEGLAAGVRALAANGLKYAQSGFAQTYLVLMILGAAAVVAFLVR